LRKPDYDRRVVVTGLGVISSIGNDAATAWANLVNGVSGLGPITLFDTTPYEAKLGGEVHDFDPTDWMDPKAARRSESSTPESGASRNISAVATPEPTTSTACPPGRSTRPHSCSTVTISRK